MRYRLVSTLTIALTVFVGCSSDKTGNTPATFPVGVPGATAATAPLGTGFFGSATSASCETDLKTLELAVESYRALNDRYPDSEAELIEGGLLVNQSEFHDVTAGGVIVPAPSQDCVR